MQKKIVISGGEGRFAQVLKRDNKKLDILYPSKKELNILNINSINKYLKKKMNFLNMSKGDNFFKKQVIKTTTLDKYLYDNHIFNVDLIKIDTEGHEFHVLKGGKKILNNELRPILVLQLGENVQYLSVQ